MTCKTGDSIQAALAGVDAVFYIAPAFLPGEASVGQAVIAAAIRAGVRRLVFSSVIHPVLSLINHAAKAPVEEALYDSGLEYTVLQPALFFQNYARSWTQTVRSGVLAEPWSPRTRFSRVDYRDVAEAAAIALTEDRLLGGTYELASDGQLDRYDVAALISEVTGRPIRAERLDPGRLGDTPAPMRVMFEHYDSSGLVSNDVTLRAVLEHPPRTLRSYFEELAAQPATREPADTKETA
ncbi:MAG TPA: NmrA family NAD(P)-binding protein [Streptosporangiaceae bacterium]|nr:NmrA family NAD(P)-binding protein [Streptosporangiaceae bacterium]